MQTLRCHAVKALLTSRALLVKIKRDLENQIRGLLKNLGRVIGRAKFNGFAARAAELIEDRPELIAVVAPLLKAREAIEKQIDDLDGKVLKLARHDAQIRRFMTASLRATATLAVRSPFRLASRMPKPLALTISGLGSATRRPLRIDSMAPARQSNVSADTSRPLEACRIVDCRLKAKCGDWPDARQSFAAWRLHIWRFMREHKGPAGAGTTVTSGTNTGQEIRAHKGNAGGTALVPSRSRRPARRRSR
jgi:transposase